jgi:hypothetical protein
MKALFLSLLVTGALAQNPGPVPCLNHFYVTVDPKTYASCEASPFLKENFAVFEKRTTVRADRTYTGIYFYGLDTYFEFFEAGRKNSETHSGVAFGMETPGVAARLGGAGKVMTITRDFQGQALPWFVQVTPPWTGPVLRTWMMEYIPEFTARWHPELRASPSLRRQDVLALYAAALGARQSDRLLEGVAGLTLALPEGEAAIFFKAAARLGANVAEKRVTLADAVIDVVPADAAKHGIIEVRMKLRAKPAKPGVRTFGVSRLELRPDQTAVWSF